MDFMEIEIQKAVEDLRMVVRFRLSLLPNVLALIAVFTCRTIFGVEDINLSEGDTIAACENLLKTINKGDNRIDDFYKKIYR